MGDGNSASSSACGSVQAGAGRWKEVASDGSTDEVIEVAAAGMGSLWEWGADVTATAAEWRAMLIPALSPYPWTPVGDHGCQVSVGDGTALLSWTPLAPRVIARLRLPRLRVTLQASGVSAMDWDAFLRRLALYTRRGGG